MSEKNLRIALTSFENTEQAKLLAEKLVEEGLIVCAQIDAPMLSIYPWKGEVVTDKEVRLWMKIRIELVEKVERKVHDLHPYEIPQWVVIKPEGVSKDYLNWAYGDTD